ncbi:hypothetical protein EWB00_004061, partial [Schistosoma japonicum]
MRGLADQLVTWMLILLVIFTGTTLAQLDREQLLVQIRANISKISDGKTVSKNDTYLLLNHDYYFQEDFIDGAFDKDVLDKTIRPNFQIKLFGTEYDAVDVYAKDDFLAIRWPQLRFLSNSKSHTVKIIVVLYKNGIITMKYEEIPFEIDSKHLISEMIFEGTIFDNRVHFSTIQVPRFMIRTGTVVNFIPAPMVIITNFPPSSIATHKFTNTSQQIKQFYSNCKDFNVERTSYELYSCLQSVGFTCNSHTTHDKLIVICCRTIYVYLYMCLVTLNCYLSTYIKHELHNTIQTTTRIIDDDTTINKYFGNHNYKNQMKKYCKNAAHSLQKHSNRVYIEYDQLHSATATSTNINHVPTDTFNNHINFVFNDHEICTFKPFSTISINQSKPSGRVALMLFQEKRATALIGRKTTWTQDHHSIFQNYEEGDCNKHHPSKWTTRDTKTLWTTTGKKMTKMSQV